LSCVIVGLRLAAALLLVGALFGNAAADTVRLADKPVAEAGATSDPAFDAFLDRLMRAESGGRDTAANPRSTALGAFQFIKSTFVEVARRHFADEVAKLNETQLLALRTNREFARRAAAAFSMDNAGVLKEQGLNPTFGHLRLAFLVGPYAAARLLQVPPRTAVSEVLTAGVLKANPFMVGMTAADLIARTARDVSGERAEPAPQPRVREAAAAPKPRIAPRPAVAVAAAKGKSKCNERLASCRKLIALQGRKLKTRRADSRHVPGRLAGDAVEGSESLRAVSHDQSDRHGA
jgi:hypothetical protein